MQLDPLISAILACRQKIPANRALLVGISGIDASGKEFVASRIAKSLGEPIGVSKPGYNVAVIGADGWLNLPHIRFHRKHPAEHFYECAFRFDELFATLILPLRQNREIDLRMNFTEETATEYREHRYQFRAIDIILLEGIFLLKKSLRPYFDLTCWVECSFETALARAIERGQEGLPPLETADVFSRIYSPAQEIHFERDAPQEHTDLILLNDEKTTREHSVLPIHDFASQPGGRRSK